MAPTHHAVPLGHLNEASANGKISTRTTTRNVTPSPVQPTVLPIVEPVGSWLCTEGPYQQYIAALSESNPGLKKADPNNRKNPLKLGNALVVLLDSDANGQPKFEKTEFLNATVLRTHFENAPRNHNRRRIYIMEGLAPDFVAAIGGHFYMEPTFWLRQERTCVWSNDFTPVSDALPQPSLLNPQKSFHVQYCELREFNKALENKPYFCDRTRRHVGMTAPRHGEENSTTAIMRRKVSWWCEKTSGGGWDVVILCDPQLAELHPAPREKMQNAEPREIKNPDINLENKPFQGGYIDFVPPPLPQPGSTPIGPRHPHKSMLRDLVYYYENNSHLLEPDEWEIPSESAIFLKKIVAAHYLQLADYIKAMLPSLELKLTTAWVEEQEQWKGLQTISRRCGNYRDDIEDTLLSLGYTLDNPSSKDNHNWKNCNIDYQYVYFRLKILKERADNLMTSMTGLASIAGNRQNLEEAKRVKRLNLLALLFIPLAYTSSLFSMQDNYAPNKSQFWVYWVCALGVVMATSVVTWVLDRALNDEAQWTLDPIRFLKFWGLPEEKTKTMKTMTGFYKTNPRR
ncbi:uncharacterized protein EKO05_0001838 [Ascochyta rabiei]|uniref:uncharacterized protein n=1 Tax=Didymella rabiei TaxID=5454 RepID=UPI0018FF7F9A|nr:uncharacterized protein EKO05_0001838 [Ascochyta rabiei]UPX11218.1 hypothetical protein EKO05_0001838 [Ascochyta rabiei]